MKFRIVHETRRWVGRLVDVAYTDPNSHGLKEEKRYYIQKKWLCFWFYYHPGIHMCRYHWYSDYERAQRELVEEVHRLRKEKELRKSIGTFREVVIEYEV